MNRSLLLAAISALLLTTPGRAIERALVAPAAPNLGLGAPALAPSLVAPAMPAAAAVPGADAAASAADAASPASAATALQALGAQSAASAPQGADAAAVGSFEQRYDGSAIPQAASVDGDGAGNGGFSGGNGGPAGPAGPNDGGLQKAYPRVVIVLDTFKEPASETTVSYIEKLADLGVHVVFVTARPEKGANSAESILTSKLRTRAGNPVMVFSYNGARVSMHRATRAENPKGAVADAEGFAPATLELFSAVNEAARKRFKISVDEVSSGVQDNVYLYGAQFQLPKKVTKAARAEYVKAVQRFYNDQLAAAGRKVRFEASETPEGKVLLQVQSEALHDNTGRLFAAIDAQYPDLRGRLRPQDVFFFADSGAQKFLNTLQAGHGIHGTSNEAELEQGLFAVLHGRGLQTVKVTRNQLRSYVSWMEARQRYGTPRGGGGGFSLEPSYGRYQQAAKFYLAIVHYHLMGELYHRMRNHDFFGESGSDLGAALQLLDKMASNPKAFGISISPDLQHMRESKRFKPFERDRMAVIRQWVINYYGRNLPNFPGGVDQTVVGSMLNLARDSGTNVKLYYESPMTKRQYEVGVLPARGEIVNDEHGPLLIVHAYRTGKELRQDNFEESLEINLAMRAMLQGYAKFNEADGSWSINGKPARVMAVYHTMTRDLPSKIMSWQEIDARSSEVTGLIEKMMADKEFLAYWEAEQAKNDNVAVGRATKKLKKEALSKTGRKKKA